MCHALARSIEKEAKVYFYDNGMVLGDVGIRFENLVAVSLLKHLNAIEDYQGKKTSLKTLRTKEKKGVVFVLVFGESRLVCWKSSCQTRRSVQDYATSAKNTGYQPFNLSRICG